MIIRFGSTSNKHNILPKEFDIVEYTISNSLLESLTYHIELGARIEAIKKLRSETYFSLRDAKNIVEYIDDHIKNYSVDVWQATMVRSEYSSAVILTKKGPYNTIHAEAVALAQSLDPKATVTMKKFIME